MEMWQTWFKDELKLEEDHGIHLLKLDCAQLILLQSREAVASKCPGLQAPLQVLIGRSVADLLRKWDAPEQRTPVQRSIGVKAGDDAKREYFPHELRRDYVPL